MAIHKMFVLSWSILVSLFLTIATAGPTISRLNRIKREVYPEIEPDNDGNSAQQVCIVGDVVYGIDEPVPAEQPCLKCRCQPPGVQCETIKCLKKPGCKAIHRPNKCCPDYQCECEHEGKVYANGEKLKTVPGGECQVCYCRGGEVQCAQVSCYIRTDCKGKTVPGQCCPKYDNCPPIDLFDRPSYTTTLSLPDVNKEVLELWPLTTLLQNSSDDNTSPSNYDNQDLNKISDSETKVSILPPDEQPKITIQEIIPVIQEIPVTSSPKTEVETITNKFDSTNDLIVTDSEPDSSEVSEVFQQPPPVLRIGDKLLFLKKGELIPEKDANTPSSIITIIGAEGLQRGYEDSSEVHDHELKNGDNPSFNNSNDLDTKAEESTHILSLVKRKSTTTQMPTTITENQIDSTTPLTLDISTISFENSTNDVENITETVIGTTEIILDENPAYPHIPDVMKPENPEQFQHEIEKNSTELKILQHVLLIRANKTIPQNVSNSEWLKTDINNETLLNPRAALPDEILKQIAPSDIITTDFPEYNETATSFPLNFTDTERSVESIEVTTDYSAKVTTPENETNHEPIVSNENVSVEIDISSTALPSVSEISDLLSETEHPSTMNDVEMLNDPQGTKNEDEKIETTTNPMDKDVELILTNQTAIDISEKLESKIIEKRENSPEDENDEVFRQLNDELDSDSSQKDFDDNEEESQKIFQELLEETSTPKTRKQPQNKDEETLQRVSDAIAKATLGTQRNPFDGEILSLISNFFTGQYRQEK